MNETTEVFGFSWWLFGCQVAAFLICIALVVGLAVLMRVAWRAWRKKQ